MDVGCCGNNLVKTTAVAFPNPLQCHKDKKHALDICSTYLESQSIFDMLSKLDHVFDDLQNSLLQPRHFNLPQSQDCMS
jgi:hypothetical protein